MKTDKYYRNRLSPRMENYIKVGLSVYIFEVLIIIIAIKARAGNVLAVAISYSLGLIASFILQKFITFNDKRTHHKIVIAQFLAVVGLVIFNFAFTVVLTKILSNTLPAVVCRTIALSITTLWNYYLYRTRIFSGRI